MTPFEREVFDVIREALMLPDPPPAGFGAASNLFDTFGLDSVDALEIVMVLRKHFGVEFSQQDEEKKKIFANLGALAAYVAEQKGAGA